MKITNFTLIILLGFFLVSCSKNIKVLAVVDKDRGTIVIINKSTFPLTDVRAYINNKYCTKIEELEPGYNYEISLSNFVSDDGESYNHKRVEYLYFTVYSKQGKYSGQWNKNLKR